MYSQPAIENDFSLSLLIEFELMGRLNFEKSTLSTVPKNQYCCCF